MKYPVCNLIILSIACLLSDPSRRFGLVTGYVIGSGLASLAIRRLEQ